jgi:hypothetical protein
MECTSSQVCLETMTIGPAPQVLREGKSSRIESTKELIVCFNRRCYAGKLRVTRDTGKRKREESKLSLSSKPDFPSTDNSGIGTKPSCLVQRKTAPIEPYASLEELWPLFYSAIGSRNINRFDLERVGKLCGIKGMESERVIAAFQQWVDFQNAVSCPRADYLLVLVKFNVFRALFSNGTILGLSTAGEYFDDDANSSFAKSMNTRSSFLSLPSALQPTRIQCQIPHHPSLDLLPDPQMRDNLIRASGAYDEDALCADLIGLSTYTTGRSGLIIWGEPWDLCGWEVTEPFWKHWQWALNGCDELLRATNHWRNKRGEPSLHFNVAIKP